jgi:hypothetical protein
MSADALVRQPIPLARSILWGPTTPDARRPDNIPFPIFLTQSVLVAIQEHVAPAPPQGQGRLGFLVGDLCECPETNVSYLLIDAALRLSQPIYGDRTTDLVTRIWERIEAQVEEAKGHLIGWYHSHLPLPLTLTAHDIETHEHYFGEPWQIALLLGTGPDGAEPAAGFFRAGSAEEWSSTLLPFHEVVPEESVQPGGKKLSLVTWKNYRAFTPLSDRSPRTQARVAAQPPPPPPAPTSTPESAPRPTAPPQPARESSEPPAAQPSPPPAAPKSDELVFLSSADDFASPPPPRPSGGAMRSGSPIAPAPPPPPPPAPPPPQPSVRREPPREIPTMLPPAIEPDASLIAAEEPVLDTPELEPGPIEESPPRAERAAAVPRRRRRRRRALWVTLFAILAVGGGGGLYVWRGGGLPSLPTLPSLHLHLPTLSSLPFFKRAGTRPPNTTAPPPAPVASRGQPATAAPTPGQLPVAHQPLSAALTGLDRSADELTQAVRAFGERAGLFQRQQLTCPGLVRGLLTVEERWVTYSKARSTSGALDRVHTAQDQRLYAGVDSVERRYDQTGCARP